MTARDLTAKHVYRRFESPRVSTKSFHFRLYFIPKIHGIIFNSSVKSRPTFFSAQLEEHFIPILESLRFESSGTFTQNVSF